MLVAIRSTSSIEGSGSKAIAPILVGATANGNKQNPDPSDMDVSSLLSLTKFTTTDQPTGRIAARGPTQYLRARLAIAQLPHADPTK